MRKCLILILISFFIYIACKKKFNDASVETADKSEYPIQTEIIDSVKTAMNPDYPRDKHIKYTLIEEFAIGDETVNEESLLNRPTDVKADSEGNIYIVDWGDVNIKVFDKQGHFLKTIGRKGQGPGEFAQILFFDIAKDDTLYVLDSFQHRMSQLEKNGTYIAGFRVEGWGTDIQVNDADHIYISTRTTPEVPISDNYQIVEQTLTIFKSNIDGNIIHNYGQFSGDKIMKKRISATSTSSGSHPLAPNTAWAVDKENRFYVGYNTEYELTVCNPEGQAFLRFGRHFNPIKNEKYKPGISLFEDWPAFYKDIVFDDQGNLWLLLYSNKLINYDEEVEEDYYYDIFSQEGIYVNRVSSPHRIYHIKNSKAYTLHRSEEGYRIVKRFRITTLEASNE